MPENVELPSVIEGCVPREDVLKGTHKLESFAANLAQVAEGKGPDVYTDPEKFFENTYPTEGLKTTIKEVFGRLVGSFEGTPVIQLETGLGGGKTHTLIALYHLAKHGSEIKGAQRFVGDLKIEPMHVVALVGTELGVGGSGNGPKTLWGEMAVQLKGKKGYDLVASSDKNMTSPGERVLRELFEDDKCLILIDELALYLTKASAVPIGKTHSNFSFRS
ncbi:MAG: ATP-binding protein [Deltaproteobacteria bacterium]|nr:ATP-binding protein [Deltaproteobacteria bacterium]